jgi:DNA-binding MarR family transcriptional regulator
MKKDVLTPVLIDWSSTFIRLSLHDFNRFTRQVGLSLVQMSVLTHLYYRGPSEVTNFCEMLQISPAGASQMIERLVQEGMVQRAETPGDRRVRLVHLTEKGREVILQSIEARRAWISQLVATLSIEEQARIAEALRLLSERAGNVVIHPV